MKQSEGTLSHNDNRTRQHPIRTAGGSLYLLISVSNNNVIYFICYVSRTLQYNRIMPTASPNIKVTIEPSNPLLPPVKI